MAEEFIGIQNLDTGIGSAGVGFVVVPSDIDREQYISDCYRTNTLTINGGRGYGYFSGVHTDIMVMQNISFPTDDENRGTSVVWIKDGISQLPVIIGTLRKQDEYYVLGENQYRLKRENVEKTRSVEFFVDGDESCLEVNILGDKDEPANLNIKVNSENKDSVFNLSCDNELNISSEKIISIESNEKFLLQVTDQGIVKCNLSYENGIGLVYTDEFGNNIFCKEGEVDIISDKINHNTGGEPMVLGETLAELLTDILKAIQKIKVISPAGETSIPMNVLDFVALQKNIEKIKSKKSNLD
jgi:hypothetical protein